MPGLDFAALIPERSAADILAGQLHLTLGGKLYTLRVLPIKATREWLTNLEDGTARLLGLLDKAGDMDGVLGAFRGVTDQLEAALRAYDRDNVLPPHEQLEEEATDTEVLMAVLAVWSAANPFASVALSAMRQVGPLPTPAPPTNGTSRHTNGSPPPTGGARRRSKRA